MKTTQLIIERGACLFFHEDYIYGYATSIVYDSGWSVSFQQALQISEAETIFKREEAINNLLNDTSTEDFAIENLIAELDITDTDQKNWLFANATEASLMVAFLDANRVNGAATAEAMDFATFCC